ncbi:MAG: hypothetical protein JEZ11_27775 [Desulfobacterales bacterium]|nr:hypothetical protein [Desulfobacterales bacterium]
MASTKVKRSGRPAVHYLIQDEFARSRAGVIPSTKCMNASDCHGCASDKKVRDDFKAGRLQAGPMGHTPAMMRLLVKDLKCRHMLNGRVNYKLCAHGFNCVKCPYDQMIEDFAVMPRPLAIQQTPGLAAAR